MLQKNLVARLSLVGSSATVEVPEAYSRRYCARGASDGNAECGK
jgi:hypothetical protein